MINIYCNPYLNKGNLYNNNFCLAQIKNRFNFLLLNYLYAISNTSYTLLKKASGVNGFYRRTSPFSNSLSLIILQSVYPDI